MSWETRVVPTPIRVERRAEGDAPEITGFGLVYNKDSLDLGGFIERIAPGASKDALKDADIRGLFNHDPNFPLGRTAAGTMDLEERDAGVFMTIRPPDARQDVVEAIERGDVTGASFSFEVEVDEWETVKDGPDRRTIKKFAGFRDFGPVTFPAYPDTKVAARAHEQWLETRSPGHRLVTARRRLDLLGLRETPERYTVA